jgi:hypothetical protein
MIGTTESHVACNWYPIWVPDSLDTKRTEQCSEEEAQYKDSQANHSIHVHCDRMRMYH